MAIQKTEAIVLKGWKLGETSKIVLLYTKDYGRIKVVAKGARNPKSQFKGCLEPLSRIDIIYYDKRNRDLQLLSKADLIDPHYHVIGHMLKTSLCLAVAELLNKAVAGEESFPHVYNLFAITLDLINRSDRFIEGFFWFFENRFINLMGYSPNWSNCLRCNASLRDNGGIFQPSSGGLVCSNCGSALSGRVISGDALEILFWLQHCSPEEAGNINPSLEQQSEIRRALDFYRTTHLEHVKKLNALRIFYRYAQKAE